MEGGRVSAQTDEYRIIMLPIVVLGALTPGALTPRARPPTASFTPGAAELTLADGELRFSDGTVVLEGVASALRPSPSASGGLFLHAEFETDAAAHDLKLGMLCASRLLGCARTTRYWVAPQVLHKRFGAATRDTVLAGRMFARRTVRAAATTPRRRCIPLVARFER